MIDECQEENIRIIIYIIWDVMFVFIRIMTLKISLP